MARSSYIYVVVDSDRPPGTGQSVPRAGFTVKYELVTWLGRQADPFLYDVYRLPDGIVPTCTADRRAATKVEISDLLDFTAPKYVR